MPSATRSGVPNRLPNSGISEPLGILEQQRGTAGTQHAIADFGNFEVRIHLNGYPPKFASLFQLS